MSFTPEAFQQNPATPAIVLTGEAITAMTPAERQALAGSLATKLGVEATVYPATPVDSAPVSDLDLPTQPQDGPIPPFSLVVRQNVSEGRENGDRVKALRALFPNILLDDASIKRALLALMLAPQRRQKSGDESPAPFFYRFGPEEYGVPSVLGVTVANSQVFDDPGAVKKAVPQLGPTGYDALVRFARTLTTVWDRTPGHPFPRLSDRQ